MSRRYCHRINYQQYDSSNRSHQPHESITSGNKNYQNKFVPKHHNPNSNCTLSDSLRQSVSYQYGAVSSSRRDHSGGNFVNYLPQDEAVAAGLPAEDGGLDPLESQRAVDLLNRELSRLLKLKPRDFWREVAGDRSLHDFLDSFLKYRSRWYDFPHRGAKAIVAGVIVGEVELSRRVFMLLYRISSNRDPGARAANSLSSTDHSVLLQEKKLLDLPKLLDICAIFGHENEELTRLLVENALKAQPGIHDHLTAILTHSMGIVHTMYQRCISSLEALFSSGIGNHEDTGFKILQSDFLEVMDFLNDAIVSMDAFVNAYKPAALVFSCPVEMSHGNEELLITLARLHDTLLPSLQQGFRIILAERDDGMMSNIAVSLKMLSRRIAKFGWKLLDFSYLSNEVFMDITVPAITKIFPAKVEDPIIRADILIQIFREIGGVLLYKRENFNGDTFLQNLDKNYHLMSRLQSLQNAGWIMMDDEQIQYLSGTIASSLKNDNVKDHPVMQVPAHVPGSKAEMDEDTIIKESKISQIKDLFPDLGKGFLAACLEVYNQDPEEVIQRILEGTLHEDLKRLDISRETVPIPKAAPTMNNKDKGKGKLVESAPDPSIPILSTKPVAARELQREDHLFPSSSGAGRFIRKSNDVSGSYTLYSGDEKDAAKKMALISQYEYEDEYDDSFDDLGTSVAESGFEENEMLSDRISSNLERSSGTDVEGSTQAASDTKWGSRKKPQFFVKDGKNYSYKVAGSVGVANAGEAQLLSQAQVDLIYGLGRGGNIPMGAVKKWTEHQESEQRLQEYSDEPETEGKGSSRSSRGRGRIKESKGERTGESQDEQNNQYEVRETGNSRGRGRERRGRGANHYRKDRATRKHFSGLSGV